MHKDLVEKKKWIAEDHFLQALNFCMLLSGPGARQLATYIGCRRNRFHRHAAFQMGHDPGDHRIGICRIYMEYNDLNGVMKCI